MIYSIKDDEFLSRYNSLSLTRNIICSINRKIFNSSCVHYVEYFSVHRIKLPYIEYCYHLNIL